MMATQDFIEKLQSSGEVSQLLHSIDTSVSSTHPTSHSLCRALSTSWTALSAVDTPRKDSDLEDKTDSKFPKEECSDDNSTDSAFWAQVAMDYSWEQLHTGYWQDVQLVWRQAFALGSLLKALNLALLGKREEAMRELDKGLLLGVPIMNDALQRLADILLAKRVEQKKIGKIKFRNYTPISTDPDIREKKMPDEKKMPNFHQQSHLTCDVAAMPLINMARRIAVEYCPSLVDFRECHMIPSAPVVITGAMDHWPAYAEKKWSLGYLRSVAGLRTVPVELGSRYTDHDWSQKLMTMADFIDNHVVPSSKTDSEETVKAYLAQHQLFDQIPELRDDITIPDYCCLRTDSDKEVAPKVGGARGDGAFTSGDDQEKREAKREEREVEGDQTLMEENDIPLAEGVSNSTPLCVEGEKKTADCEGAGDSSSSHVKINCWFGPMGTVSPLHFDPEHNLLAQVVGRKYIRLYARDQTPYLYPHTGMLTNTSQVDVECPDLSRFPQFSRAEYTEFTLHAGQMLYIPPQCWHHVRALDVSFSVSFWWS